TNTGTIEIKGVMDNPDLALWVGQFANVLFEIDQLKGAVLVDEAVINIGVQGPYLYVVNANNTVSLRWISVGENYNNKVVIKSNLEAGETVVTLGQMNLYDGALVVVDNTVPQAPNAPQAIGKASESTPPQVAAN
ncbi:MAG TPA: hypothetical protein PLV25_00735, partial [Opitutales bacterium]|nr:hypothetical protein [Opitutales bacterium]